MSNPSTDMKQTNDAYTDPPIRVWCFDDYLITEVSISTYNKKSEEVAKDIETFIKAENTFFGRVNVEIGQGLSGRRLMVWIKRKKYEVSFEVKLDLSLKALHDLIREHFTNLKELDKKDNRKICD